MSLGTIYAHWPMNEASDGSTNVTRVDATGRGNDLTSVNTVASGTGLLASAADLEFSNAEYLGIASNGDVQLGDLDFWIQLWFKRESADTESPMLISKCGSIAIASQTEYQIRLFGVGNPVVLNVALSNGTTRTVFAGTSGIALNTWYRVLLIHDAVNDRVKVWLNNTLEIDQAYSLGCLASTRPFNIGANNNSALSAGFDGLIDEVTLAKDGAPTDEEASILYNEGTPLPYPFKMLVHPGMTGRTQNLVGGLAA